MWSKTILVLYSWHVLDGLIHLLYESSYIYNCFTSYTIVAIPETPSLPLHFPSRLFLGHRDRLYGNLYANNLFATSWLTYARADKRYAGIDLTTLSLEIITVFLAGPLAIYVASGIYHDVKRRSGVIHGSTWFWATVLASAELYGGLMNFLPEWLSGCENLDTSDPVHLWLYIVFFNAVWAVFPMWVLRCAYRGLADAFEAARKNRPDIFNKMDGALLPSREKE